MKSEGRASQELRICGATNSRTTAAHGTTDPRNNGITELWNNGITEPRIHGVTE